VTQSLAMPTSLGEILDRLQFEGKITQSQLTEIVIAGKSVTASNKHPLQLISERTGLSLDGLIEWWALLHHLPQFTIDPLKIDVANTTQMLSQGFAAKHQILCVAVDDESVTIATATPSNKKWHAGLEHTTKRQIKTVMARPDLIARYIDEFYTMADSISGMTADNDAKTQDFEQLVAISEQNKADGGDQHVVKIVDWLLQFAFEQKVSDVHIEPRREGGKVRFRIDGVLHEVYRLPSHVLKAVTGRIKVLGRMNIAEKRKPQDGRIKTLTPDGQEVELRLSTMPTAFGEKLVMRIFDPEVLLRSFEQLGLSGSNLKKWHQWSGQPNGIVLVTGPTGSGKTTTLYSTLKELATDQVNLSTIEDPIEMITDSFNQMQVQSSIGLTFAEGMRTLMRQDPDVIMVGEIRDLETAQMAVQAALTGHLVFSTLHTNDSTATITRLLDLGVPSYLIRSTLVGVMAQRLVRTLCNQCKVPAEIDNDSWRQLTHPWRIDKPAQVFKPQGCESCRNTGYSGRIGLYELFETSEKTKKLINDQVDLSVLRRQAMSEGLKSLRLSGALRIAEGLTTFEEVVRVVPTHDD